jgi:hypothetical protein
MQNLSKLMDVADVHAALTSHYRGTFKNQAELTAAQNGMFARPGSIELRMYNGFDTGHTVDTVFGEVLTRNVLPLDETKRQEEMNATRASNWRPLSEQLPD